MNFVWIGVLIITAIRLFVAALGNISEIESYLLLCGHHLDWGFVEGPPGVAALMRASSCCWGESPLGIRFLSPLLILFSSIILFRLVRVLRDKESAVWTVLIFNLLPITNKAALVMEGTSVLIFSWLLGFAMALTLVSDEENQFWRWLCLGAFLGVATQITYNIGLFFPLICGIELFQKRKESCFRGMAVAFLLLVLGWVGPLWWNQQHDWLQWHHNTWASFWSWQLPTWSLFVQTPLLWITPLEGVILATGLWQAFISSFKIKKNHRKEKLSDLLWLVIALVPICCFFKKLGQGQAAFALEVVIVVLFLPYTLPFFLKRAWWYQGKWIFLGALSLFSLLLLFFPQEGQDSSWTIPDVRGVVGLRKAAAELLRVRALESAEGEYPPFLIAQTAGLAALLSAVIPVHYPDLPPEAPSVFTPESPAFNSQFQLWPHYADATMTAVVDPLYTEEKKTSPFLGFNALYVTRESLEEIPQIIQGSFVDVEYLSEIKMEKVGRKESFFIYRCKKYEMLSL